MVGQNIYTEEQIKFLLECQVKKRMPDSQIVKAYEEEFGKGLTKNQLRYVKNKYGKDPKFGTPMVNDKSKKRKDGENGSDEPKTKAKRARSAPSEEPEARPPRSIHPVPILPKPTHYKAAQLMQTAARASNRPLIPKPPKDLSYEAQHIWYSAVKHTGEDILYGGLKPKETHTESTVNKWRTEIRDEWKAQDLAAAQAQTEAEDQDQAHDQTQELAEHDKPKPLIFDPDVDELSPRKAAKGRNTKNRLKAQALKAQKQAETSQAQGPLSYPMLSTMLSNQGNATSQASQAQGPLSYPMLSSMIANHDDGGFTLPQDDPNIDLYTDDTPQGYPSEIHQDYLADPQQDQYADFHGINTGVNQTVHAANHRSQQQHVSNPYLHSNTIGFDPTLPCLNTSHWDTALSGSHLEEDICTQNSNFAAKPQNPLYAMPQQSFMPRPRPRAPMSSERYTQNFPTQFENQQGRRSNNSRPDIPSPEQPKTSDLSELMKTGFRGYDPTAPATRVSRPDNQEFQTQNYDQGYYGLNITDQNILEHNAEARYEERTGHRVDAQEQTSNHPNAQEQTSQHLNAQEQTSQHLHAQEQASPHVNAQEPPSLGHGLTEIMADLEAACEQQRQKRQAQNYEMDFGNLADRDTTQPQSTQDQGQDQNHSDSTQDEDFEPERNIELEYRPGVHHFRGMGLANLLDGYGPLPSYERQGMTLAEHQALAEAISQPPDRRSSVHPQGLNHLDNRLIEPDRFTAPSFSEVMASRAALQDFLDLPDELLQSPGEEADNEASSETA